MTNTMAARAAFGMYCSGLVSRSNTTATAPAIASIDTWLRPLAESAISVLVGLPFTTKVLLSPATRFAALSPTRSVFSSNCSWYFTAYARDVAALCARMTTNIDADTASSDGTSDHPTPAGSPIDGNPLGTGPRIETPCDSRSNPQLIAIAATTATRPPGIDLIHL